MSTSRDLPAPFSTSMPLTFKVSQPVKPTIDLVTDDKGTAVPPGGSTVSTTLTLRGLASAGLRVEILDGGSVLKTETVRGTGAWISTLTGLAAKTYTLKARGLYGANPESEVWGLTVQTGVCDDLSTAPLGRLPDNRMTQLTSVLNCAPGFGETGSSPEAQIVQVGNNRELQWFISASGGLNWRRLNLGIRDLDYPLKSPLKITLEFYLTQSVATVVALDARYYLAGEQSKQISVEHLEGTIALTIPAGAELSRNYTVGGLYLAMTPYKSEGGQAPSLVHLKSVCLSQ